MIDLILHCEPGAKGRPRFRVLPNGGISTYTDSKTRAKESELAWLVRSEYHLAPLARTIPLKVAIKYVIQRPKHSKREYPITRPDIDNYIKSSLDSLNGILWADDSSIVCLEARKEYGEPRVEIKVEEL